MRQALFVAHKSTRLLVDFGPDIRAQMLANGIDNVDGVLMTHSHSDHSDGLDEIRALFFARRNTVEVYMDSFTYKTLYEKFSYLFNMKFNIDGKSLHVININIIEPEKKYKIKDIEFEPFEQEHGNIKSLGFKFKNFAYSTDFYSLKDDVIEKLKNIDLWILECAGYAVKEGKKNLVVAQGSHIRLPDALNIVKKVSPSHAIFIHMSHEIDFNMLSKELPENIELAYDGMLIKKI